MTHLCSAGAGVKNRNSQEMIRLDKSWLLKRILQQLQKIMCSLIHRKIEERERETDVVVFLLFITWFINVPACYMADYSQPSALQRGCTHVG